MASPQYEGLSQLYEDYRARGFSVLGFLTNDFRQAGSDEQIEECVDMYSLKFERFAQIGVLENSPDGQDPIFAWLTSQNGFEGAVSWNFNKFLVSADGELLARWNQFTAPNDPTIIQAIEAALDND